MNSGDESGTDEPSLPSEPEGSPDLSPPDSDEDDAVFTSDEPASPGVAAVVESEHLHEIRTNVLYGVGGLLALSIVLYPLLAFFRPEASEAFAGMSQTVTSGLMGIGGAAAGYAFGSRK